MKKIIFTILLYGVIVLGITGCDKETTLPLPNDTTYEKYETIGNLGADNVDINYLFKFKDILYGKSYALIDYAGGSEPVGKIEKLIDENLIPKNNGETNNIELLNAPIYDVTKSQAIVNFNNEYILFEALD